MTSYTKEQMSNLIWYIEQLEEMDIEEQMTFEMDCLNQAQINGLTKGMVDKMLKEARRAIKKAEQMNSNMIVNGIMFATGKNGIENSAENFLKVFRQDSKFTDIRWNELSDAPEILENGKWRRWKDTDDSKSRNYIEARYRLSADRKYHDAITEYFDEKRFHPVRNEIESIKWDGIDRIETLLIRWLKVEDTPYNREASRLIFAGGINRIYNPGCKFDDVVVLIGTKQGEGKSTFVRWLALKDEFFAELTNVDPKEGAEAVEGAFVCEMSEMLALTRTREVEAVKSFITRQSDSYRRPYDRHKSEKKRQCVFIGTTNKKQFLTDITGNRRFHPLTVNSSGFDIFDHEDEIKNEIRQCWAEAKERFDAGIMPPYMDKKFINEARIAQSEACEEDWRVPIIEDYLDMKTETCVMAIKVEALGMEWNDAKNKKADMQLTEILTKLGWAQDGTKKITISVPGTSETKRQRKWIRLNAEEKVHFDSTNVPF